jgi:hypothetical protein
MDVIGWDKIGAWIANNPQTVVKLLNTYFAAEGETFLGRYFEPLAALAPRTRFDGFDLAAHRDAGFFCLVPCSPHREALSRTRNYWRRRSR